jgi:hypothetical protein
MHDGERHKARYGTHEDRDCKGRLGQNPGPVVLEENQVESPSQFHVWHEVLVRFRGTHVTLLWDSA